MQRRVLFLMLLGGLVTMGPINFPVRGADAMYPALQLYVRSRIAEFDQIPLERQHALDKIAEYIRTKSTSDEPARITYICSHNSRRSQFAQLWATVAGAYYGVSGLEAFSAGTEVTAFNPRAVDALQRAGWKFTRTNDSTNPSYAMSWCEVCEPIECFSKVFADKHNPSVDFLAVMVCSDADRSCPSVPGAADRLAIPYVDPKIADGAPHEAATYDERCAQIAREMLYAFSRVKKR